MVEELDIDIVVCNPLCGGDKNLCLSRIKEIVDNKHVAFMIFSYHVKEKVEELGYSTHTRYENTIPIGLYIYSTEAITSGH